MEQFKTGFLEYAINDGLSQSEAAHLWKRASEYPGTEQVFKNLDIKSEQTPNIPGEDLSTLSKLMEQQKVQQELQAIKHQLGI
jgi:hypothetical protein